MCINAAWSSPSLFNYNSKKLLTLPMLITVLVCGVAVVPSVAGRVLTPGSSTAPAAAGPSGTAAVQLYSVQCTPCSTAHACCAVLHRNVTPVLLLLHHRTPPPSPVTLSDSTILYTTHISTMRSLLSLY